MLYYFRCTIQFSAEPLKRHDDGRKTKMRLFAILWHSSDKFCVCLQNVCGRKIRCEEKLHECSSSAKDHEVSWANAVILRENNCYARESKVKGENV